MEADMSNELLVVVILVLVALLIPMRFDPAIRLREWLDRRRRP
jgi:hypothetical protein